MTTDVCTHRLSLDPQSNTPDLIAQDGTRVVLMRFNTGGVAASSVQSAVLRLHVSAAGNGLNQFLVLGIRGAADTRETGSSVVALAVQSRV